MTKPKLDLKSLSDQQVIDLLNLVTASSGKRYWLRVSANGTAGPGPASDPATKTAP